MKPRSGTLPAISLFLLLCASFTCAQQNQNPPAQPSIDQSTAPTLADVARQARENAAKQKKTHVFTNDDISSHANDAATTATGGAASGTGAGAGTAAVSSGGAGAPSGDAAASGKTDATQGDDKDKADSKDAAASEDSPEVQAARAKLDAAKKDEATESEKLQQMQAGVQDPKINDHQRQVRQDMLDLFTAQLPRLTAARETAEAELADALKKQEEQRKNKKK